MQQKIFEYEYLVCLYNCVQSVLRNQEVIMLSILFSLIALENRGEIFFFIKVLLHIKYHILLEGLEIGV